MQKLTRETHRLARGVIRQTRVGRQNPPLYDRLITQISRSYRSRFSINALVRKYEFFKDADQIKVKTNESLKNSKFTSRTDIKNRLRYDLDI